MALLYTKNMQAQIVFQTAGTELQLYCSTLSTISLMLYYCACEHLYHVLQSKLGVKIYHEQYILTLICTHTMNDIMDGIHSRKPCYLLSNITDLLSIKPMTPMKVLIKINFKYL